jgi:hypothetical protein
MNHAELFAIEHAASEAFKKSGMDSMDLDLALHILSVIRSAAYHLEHGGKRWEAMDEVMELFE